MEGGSGRTKRRAELEAPRSERERVTSRFERERIGGGSEREERDLMY